MSAKYVKNQTGAYTIPVYRNLYFYIALLLVISIIFSLLFLMSQNKFMKNIALVFAMVALTLVTFRAIFFIVGIIKERSFKRYVDQKKLERKVTKSLLATMAVNRQKDAPWIMVPGVKVYDRSPKYYVVTVEKLPGMYEIEKISEDITSSFTGKFGSFGVVAALITDDGLMYKFKLEDVGVDKTFRPKNLKSLANPPYVLKLQKGLKVNLADRPHMAIWGKTGSKKTTVLFSLILQLFMMGADVRFIDPKDEFSAFSSFYPAEKIVGTDTSEIFSLLASLLEIIKDRQVIIRKAVQDQKTLGLKASELGLKPVVLVADEVGSAVALMESKEQKQFIKALIAIIQRGRSVGVNVIVSTQDPSVDVLPQKVRSQFSFKCLLGSASGDVQRMAFGESATTGQVEDFRGFYTLDGVTIQPMKFFVPDIYAYRFNSLSAFKKAYEFGKNLDIKECSGV